MSDSSSDTDFDDVSEYHMEDENEEGGSRRVEAVEAAILSSDSYEAFAYAEEPVADEEWLRKYYKELNEQREEKEAFERRLDGTDPRELW